MSRYTRIELLVYVSFWLLITSFAVVSSWNLGHVHTLQAARHIFGQVLLVLLPLLSPERAFVTEQFHPFTPGSAMSLIAFQSYLDSKFLGK